MVHSMESSSLEQVPCSFEPGSLALFSAIGGNGAFLGDILKRN
jgi:hypothetical protein